VLYTYSSLHLYDWNIKEKKIYNNNNKPKTTQKQKTQPAWEDKIQTKKGKGKIHTDIFKQLSYTNGKGLDSRLVSIIPTTVVSYQSEHRIRQTSDDSVAFIKPRLYDRI
jgi:hypothetical protein